MTTESRSRGELTRDRILDAALELFGSLGVAGVSVERVAQAAGMSKQALMHHFPSKEALRLAVLDKLEDRFRDELPNLVKGLEPDEGDAYRALIDRFATLFEQNPWAARFVVRELLDRPADTMAWLERNASPWLSVVSEIVAARRTEGNVPEDFDAEAHVTVLATLLLGSSALLPPGPGGKQRVKPSPWRGRVGAAARRLIEVGSGVIDFDGRRRQR